MKLTGSRSSDNEDFFSDWDFVIDTAGDFGQIYKLLDRALVWRLHSRGEQSVLTAVGPKGEIFKFSGSRSKFIDQWGKIESKIADAELHYYWILAFQYLKTLHRNYDLLAEVGIERLTGLLRDIYLQRSVDVVEYKSTYSYKAVRVRLAESANQLSVVTGLPYRSTAERLKKLRQMNHLIDSVSPKGFQAASKAFEGKLQWLEEPEPAM
ncbi:MAG: hypothetical protein AB8G95_30280 [Anaerolineae bacterium]